MTPPDPVTPLTGAVDVLCDGTGRLGALSYRVPADMVVRPGDAVHVPFGQREVHGVVLGPGNEEKATRDIAGVFGQRIDPPTLAYATELAAEHGTDIEHLAGRLSPRTNRGAPPVDPGPLELIPGPHPVVKRASRPRPGTDEPTRRFLLRAPLIDPARLAATEAYRLAALGSVLVLCPTVELLESVCEQFRSGVVRIDAKAPPGHWAAFNQGLAPVAVGTRSAALYSSPSLAAIVVAEADHPGHLEDRQPATSATRIAADRSQRAGFDLSLTGMLPLPGLLGGGVKLYVAGTAQEWPQVKVVDRREFPPDQREIPPPVQGLLRDWAHSERLVVAPSARTTRRCARCRMDRPCAQCEEHPSACTHLVDSPCPRCGAVGIRLIGYDPARLRSMFKTRARPLRAAKLTRSADPRLVIVYDIDATLAAPALVPEAEAARQLLRAAEAAGPLGQLVVLTENPGHALLVDLCDRRSAYGLARRLWAQAKERHLPPFGHLATITMARAPQRTANWPGVVFGPRQVGPDFELLVLATSAELPALRERIATLRRRGKVRVRME